MSKIRNYLFGRKLPNLIYWVSILAIEPHFARKGIGKRAREQEGKRARGEDVRMRRCEDEKMRRGEEEKM